MALSIAVAFSIATGAGTYAYLDAKTPTPESRPVAGPPRMMGLSVGATSFEAVTAAAKRAGLECEDASLVAAMRKAHAKSKVETSSKPGALAAHLKMLSDPLFFQVRYSCEGVIANPRLGLDGSAGTTGRLLFVHQNATQPLELVSYQRHHKDPAVATRDLTTTIDALEHRYGQPIAQQGGRELRLLEPIQREWHVAGTIIRVKAVWFGARGGSVSEEITLAKAP